MPKLNKYRKRWWCVAIVSLILLILNITLFQGILYYYPDAWEKEKEVIGFSVKASDEQSTITQALNDVIIHSEYALVVDMKDFQTLYEKNANERIYPASLTKVLTAIVALNLKNNMQSHSRVTEEDLSGLLEANASVAGLKVGDTLSFEDALYALILPSGGDAANFIANHMAGNITNFVEEMNKKAIALGMLDTHFVNPTGLHEDEHYTTLNDMKKMMSLGWKNPIFQDIITSLDHTIEGLVSHPQGLYLKSSLASYGSSLSFNGGEIIGGKSGYTLEAQCCLISIAKMSDGHFYLMISAKAGGQPSIDRLHLQDAKNVFETISKVRKDQ